MYRLSEEECGRLRAQFRAQEDDREFLVRQVQLVLPVLFVDVYCLLLYCLCAWYCIALFRTAWHCDA